MKTWLAIKGCDVSLVCSRVGRIDACSRGHMHKVAKWNRRSRDVNTIRIGRRPFFPRPNRWPRPPLLLPLSPVLRWVWSSCAGCLLTSLLSLGLSCWWCCAPCVRSGSSSWYPRWGRWCGRSSKGSRRSSWFVFTIDVLFQHLRFLVLLLFFWHIIFIMISNSSLMCTLGMCT